VALFLIPKFVLVNLIFEQLMHLVTSTTSFNDNAQRHRQTDRQTDDVMMLIADHDRTKIYRLITNPK